MQECKSPFILSNKKLLDGCEESALAKIMKTTSVDWLCEHHQQNLKEEDTGQNLDEESTSELDMAVPEDIAFLQFTATSK